MFEEKEVFCEACTHIIMHYYAVYDEYLNELTSLRDSSHA